MRARLAVVASASVLCLPALGIGPVEAVQAGGPAAPASSKVVCGPQGCRLIVVDPVKPKGPPQRKSKNKSPTRKSVCVTKDEHLTVPCYSPTMGYFNNADGCYYKLNQAKTDSIIMRPPGKTKGAWYDITCIKGDGVPTMRTDWLDTPPPVIPPPPVTPVALAKKAYAELKFPHPTTGRGPGGTLRNGQPYSLVRANTWFWTDPRTYKSLSKRAQAGPVWATVTVTPVALTLTPGDGARTVSCSGPGTTWVQGRDSPWSSSPSGCDYSYPHSTYGDTNDELTATYGIVWKATWVGAGGAGGTFPNITTRTQSTFAVAEAEAVVVK